MAKLICLRLLAQSMRLAAAFVSLRFIFQNKDSEIASIKSAAIAEPSDKLPIVKLPRTAAFIIKTKRSVISGVTRSWTGKRPNTSNLKCSRISAA